MSFEGLLLVHFAGSAFIGAACYQVGLRAGRRDRPRYRRVWPMGRS